MKKATVVHQSTASRRLKKMFPEARYVRSSHSPYYGSFPGGDRGAYQVEVGLEGYDTLRASGNSWDEAIRSLWAQLRQRQCTDTRCPACGYVLEVLAKRPAQAAASAEPSAASGAPRRRRASRAKSSRSSSRSTAKRRTQGSSRRKP